MQAVEAGRCHLSWHEPRLHDTCNGAMQNTPHHKLFGSLIDHDGITSNCRSVASHPLPLIRFLDLDPATPSSIPHARCITDLETTETPLVSLFRSYPEQQRSCLSRFCSASPSGPRPGDTCHEVFDMKNSTSSFPTMDGVSPPPLSRVRVSGIVLAKIFPIRDTSFAGPPRFIAHQSPSPSVQLSTLP